MNSDVEKVKLYSKTLGAVLRINSNSENDSKTKNLEFPLSIPEYQRIYCWQEKNVFRLLEDILNSEGKFYHLGTIILHHTKKNDYSIVDGQQRLVTLALFLQKLAETNVWNDEQLESELLNQKFESEEAQRYIAYNKFIIENWVTKHGTQLAINFKDNLIFSVLVISDDTLDLAYTFFSNQNSRGKALTDYDLLKAHHLRFITSQEQSRHLADRWDAILLSSNNDAKDKDLGRTLGLYIFRLRKWMRKREWNDFEKYKVKNEFEAADTISEIPPFGENFYFYESIQGGAHFFGFVDYFIYRFNSFSKLPEYECLQAYLGRETHWWYRDAIECLLFGYFLKFGTMYLTEAFICIEQLISQHRYDTRRSSLNSVLVHSNSLEIIMMIDQATSPTFFLAEALQKIKALSTIKKEELQGIRKRYYDNIKSIYKKILRNDNIIESIKKYTEEE